MRARSIRLALLLSICACTPLAVPVSARQSETLEFAPIASTTPSLFWYGPQLPTNFSPPRINSVAYDLALPGVALASEGNPGGAMLRTTDHGLTWLKLPNWNPASTSYSYRVIYGNLPHTFYAYGAVWVSKTTDDGDTWTEIPYDTNCNYIVTMVVHPTVPTTLFVGTSNGFAHSINGGQTWSSTFPFPCGGGPYAFTIGAGTDQPNVVYAGQFENYGGGVLRSSDQGVTWQAVSNGLPVVGTSQASILQVIVDPRNAAVVYALGEDGHIYKTTNSGGQWTILNHGIEAISVTSIALDVQHGYVLYAASTSQIYSFLDGGTTWQLWATKPIPQPSSFPYNIFISIDTRASGRLTLYDDNGLYIDLSVPKITSLTPNTATAGGPAFTLTVNGRYFTPAAQVQWNGKLRPTKFVSPTKITAAISASDIRTAKKDTVTVGYSGTSDGTSHAAFFTVQP